MRMLRDAEHQHSGLDIYLTCIESQILYDWMLYAQKAINRNCHRVVPITNPVMRRIWAELDAKFGDTTEATP